MASKSGEAGASQLEAFEADQVRRPPSARRRSCSPTASTGVRIRASSSRTWPGAGRHRRPERATEQESMPARNSLMNEVARQLEPEETVLPTVFAQDKRPDRVEEKKHRVVV